jgi:hypothetical protein
MRGQSAINMVQRVASTPIRQNNVSDRGLDQGRAPCVVRADPVLVLATSRISERPRGLRRYEEQASAAKSRARFDAMMRDARRGVFAVLLIWALDRFGRSRERRASTAFRFPRRQAGELRAR